MTSEQAAAPGPALEIPPPARSTRTDWRRAYAALRALLAEPDETHRAMELSLHIGGAEFERTFQRFARSPGGRALLARRPSLPDALVDRAALERMPAGSLAAAYLAYLDGNGFEPRALVEMQHEAERRWMAETGQPPLDPLRRWFRDRFMICHDLFHVVTGYGTDGVGEATLLAFGLAQEAGRASALLTFGAAAELWRRFGFAYLRHDLRGWLRGRRAVWLLAEPWEHLLPLPLEAVRNRLAIEPAEVAHPGGILRDPEEPAEPHAAA